MSQKSYQWALKRQRLKALPKAVLLRLAHEANDYGICLLVHQDLAPELGYTELRIRRAIKELGERGHISVYAARSAMRAAVRRTKNMYIVNFDGAKPLPRMPPGYVKKRVFSPTWRHTDGPDVREIAQAKEENRDVF